MFYNESVLCIRWPKYWNFSCNPSNEYSELISLRIQEMARVNVDILGISELKWTGMDEFNSDDHYIYYCGHGVAIVVNKRV